MIEFRTKQDEQKIAIFDELCEYAGVSPQSLLLQSPDPYYGATQLRGLLLEALFAKMRAPGEEPCGLG